MAKYNSSVFGNISGEVMGVVASSNKGINFIKSKAKTTDSKTQKQLARRAIYGEFCKIWDMLERKNLNMFPQRIGEKVFAFKTFLRGVLKLSGNASQIEILPFLENATMSAPQLWEVTNVTDITLGKRFNNTINFPAFDSNGDYYRVEIRVGFSPYENENQSPNLEAVAFEKIRTRQETFANTVAIKDSSISLGFYSYKVHMYADLKTGRISKPLALYANELGEIKTYYPFGK